MATFSVYNLKGEKVGTVDQPKMFSVAVDEKLIHRYLTWARSMIRSTIAHTKTRGEVSGGGKKPWRQKGTGRARVGSTRSPLWRKGGTVFGPLKEQNWATRMPRSERRKALFSAFSAKAAEDQVIILEEWKLEQPKTKSVIEVISAFPQLENKKVLFVHPGFDRNLFASSRNLPTVTSKTVANTSIIDLLNHDVLLLTKEGLGTLDSHFTTAV